MKVTKKCWSRLGYYRKPWIVMKILKKQCQKSKTISSPQRMFSFTSANLVGFSSFYSWSSRFSWLGWTRRSSFKTWFVNFFMSSTHLWKRKSQPQLKPSHRSSAVALGAISSLAAWSTYVAAARSTQTSLHQSRNMSTIRESKGWRMSWI